MIFAVHRIVRAASVKGISPTQILCMANGFRDGFTAFGAPTQILTGGRQTRVRETEGVVELNGFYA